MQQQLESGKGFIGANVHDVTALVKQFFRELPEPLFTSMYHDTFIRCYQLDNQELAKKAVLLLCLMLPGEHVNTLRFIMLLLSKIAVQSDKNKMDSGNLAVVLAPNLMHVNSKSETMKSCEEKLLQVCVVKLWFNVPVKSIYNPLNALKKCVWGGGYTGQHLFLCPSVLLSILP